MAYPEWNMKKFSLLLIGALIAMPTVAQEEKVLPDSFPVTRYTAVWENSPFTREVVKVVERKVISSFGNSLTLEGLINDDERGTVAYVKDITENETLIITSKPDPKTDGHPYTIVSADLVSDPQSSTVTITDGNETAEIGYAENALTRTIRQEAPPQQANDDDPRKQQINRARPQPNQDRPVPTPGRVSLDPPSKTKAQAELEAARKAAAAATPALERIDNDVRQRRVPLPKK